MSTKVEEMHEIFLPPISLWSKKGEKKNNNPILACIQRIFFPFWQWQKFSLIILIFPLGFVLNVYVCSVIQLSPILCHPLDCSPSDSSVLGSSQQEYWSGLPFPTPVNLPHLGIETTSLASPALCLIVLSNLTDQDQGKVCDVQSVARSWSPAVLMGIS